MDSVRIQEVYDDRSTHTSSASDTTGTIGEPKVHAWLSQLVRVEKTSDSQLHAVSLCDYAEAMDSLELALSCNQHARGPN